MTNKEPEICIWCEVWGGVTGHRAAWMKQDGAVRLFDTYEAAVTEAAERQAKANGNPYAAASYRYRAVRFGDTPEKEKT